MKIAVMNGTSSRVGTVNNFDRVQNRTTRPRPRPRPRPMPMYDGRPSRQFSANGTSSRVGTGGSPMQGIEPQPEWMSDEDYLRYKMAFAYGDPDAQMQGLGRWFRRVTAGARRRREERQNRRAEKKEIRMERRRTGTRFIDRVGTALQDFAKGSRSEADTLQALEEEGIRTNPSGLREMLTDFGGDLVNRGMQKRGTEFWAANKNWIIPVGVGVGAIGLGLATGVIPTGKKKRRR